MAAGLHGLKTAPRRREWTGRCSRREHRARTLRRSKWPSPRADHDRERTEHESTRSNAAERVGGGRPGHGHSLARPAGRSTSGAGVVPAGSPSPEDCRHQDNPHPAPSRTMASSPGRARSGSDRLQHLRPKAEIYRFELVRGDLRVDDIHHGRLTVLGLPCPMRTHTDRMRGGGRLRSGPRSSCLRTCRNSGCEP
jgi:hypothetical protein